MQVIDCYLGPHDELQVGSCLVVQRSVQNYLSTVGQVNPEELGVLLQVDR